MQCIWCERKPCVCNDTVEDAENKGRHYAKLITPIDNPYLTQDERFFAFKRGWQKGKEELNKEFVDYLNTTNKT